ncbi:hypothetical protein MRX96_040056 [Rhipicephalus microplus]
MVVLILQEVRVVCILMVQASEYFVYEEASGAAIVNGRWEVGVKQRKHKILFCDSAHAVDAPSVFEKGTRFENIGDVLL